MQANERTSLAAPFRPVSRIEAAGSLFWLVMLLLWWQGANGALWQWAGWNPPPFTAAPIWDRVAPLVIPFIAGGLARELVALVYPRAVGLYALTGLLLNAVALRALFTLLGAGEWVVVSPFHPAVVFESWINDAVWLLLLVLTIVMVISAVHVTRHLGAVGAAGSAEAGS